jgi:hypothetical protein
MNKLIAALALASAACAAPAFADVDVSIRVGEPGFYGQLDLGDSYRPRLLYSQPVVISNRHRYGAPLYVRVPREHSHQWSRYCGRYGACARPVYFVRDDWYRDVYSPRYRQQHRNYGRGDRHDNRYDRRDDRHDRYDHRDDRRDHRRDRHDDPH